MNDQTVLIILRLFHISCAIFWAGTVFYTVLFQAPAVKASGPEGAKFMQQLARTGFPIAIMIVALLTIISGILLMWKLSDGFQSEWFAGTSAKVLSMGAGFSIIAFIIGFSINRPAGMRIMKIGKAVAQSGGTPTAEQMQELMAMQKRIAVSTKYIAVLLAVTVISMSVFRYVS